MRARLAETQNSSAGAHARQALLAAVALLASVFAAHAASQDVLTQRELQALEAGELVTRPRHVQRGELDLIGGSSWQRIAAPVDQLFRAIRDVPSYVHMLPNVTASRLVEERGSERLVWIKHGAWPLEASYYVWIRTDRRSWSMSFQLDKDRPHGLRAGWGQVQLVPRSDGSTILVWSALADVGRGIFAALAQPLIQPWILRVPQTINGFWEAKGSKLYAPIAVREGFARCIAETRKFCALSSLDREPEDRARGTHRAL